MRVLTENLRTANYLSAVQSAAERAIADLGGGVSPLSRSARGWLAARCDLARPAAYFLHSNSLAILGFPWWLEESLRGTVDAAFQSELMYSSINAYFFTRMLDDIMDGHAIERAAMPALYPFHLRFMQPYQRYFDTKSAFWVEFERLLTITVEAVAGEAALVEVGAEDFLRYSARKQMAAAIPMAAVCVRHGRMDLLAGWESMLTAFARWHQMHDDVMDWSLDAKAGQATWLLREAERRRSKDEPVAAWMGREGFRWAKSVMDGWMDETLEVAAGLNSPDLVDYLERRGEAFARQIGRMIATSDAFAGLLTIERALAKA